MIKENLEQKVGLMGKLRGVAGRTVGVYALALALGGMYGCEDEPKPSEECCNEKKCKYDEVCDGDGDDCYCREETCCESIGCTSSSKICNTNEWDSSQCKCEQNPYINNKS